MDIQIILSKLVAFPYYQEVLVFIGGFFTKVFYDVYEEWKGNKKDEKSHDKELFVKIRENILPLRMMIFFRDFNPQESLSREYISPLFCFVDKDFLDPNLRFLNKKTENIKIELFQNIKDCMYSISTETYGLETNLEYQSVPKEWRIDDPGRYEEVTKILQDKAEKTWKSYESFLETGKNSLKI